MFDFIAAFELQDPFYAVWKAIHYLRKQCFAILWQLLKIRHLFYHRHDCASLYYYSNLFQVSILPVKLHVLWYHTHCKWLKHEGNIRNICKVDMKLLIESTCNVYCFFKFLTGKHDPQKGVKWRLIKIKTRLLLVNTLRRSGGLSGPYKIRKIPG